MPLFVFLLKLFEIFMKNKLNKQALVIMAVMVTSACFCFS